MTAVGPATCAPICKTDCAKHRENLVGYFKYLSETTFHVSLTTDDISVGERISNLPPCLVKNPLEYVRQAHDLIKVASKIFDFSMTEVKDPFADKQKPAVKVKEVQEMALKTIALGKQLLLTREPKDSLDLPDFGSNQPLIDLGNWIFELFYLQSKRDHKPPPNYRTITAIYEKLVEKCKKTMLPVDGVDYSGDLADKRISDEYRYVRAFQLINFREECISISRHITDMSLLHQIRSKLGYHDTYGKLEYSSVSKVVYPLIAFGHFDEANACHHSNDKKFLNYFNHISEDTLNGAEQPNPSSPIEVQEVLSLLEENKFQEAIDKVSASQDSVKEAAYEHIMMRALEFENLDVFNQVYNLLGNHAKEVFKDKHQEAHPKQFSELVNEADFGLFA